MDLRDIGTLNTSPGVRLWEETRMSPGLLAWASGAGVGVTLRAGREPGTQGIRLQKPRGSQ